MEVQIALGLVGVVTAAIGLLVVWMLLKSHLAHRLDLQVRWTQAADSLGGRLTSKGGPFSTLRIEAFVRDIPVVVDHYTRGGKGQQQRTRIGARAPGPVFELSLSREHAMSGLTKALGSQDVEVGIRTIDEGFVIKTSDEDLCRALFQTEVGQALQQAPGTYSFVAGDWGARGECDLIEDNPATLTSGVHATVALAHGDRVLRERWKQLADGLEGTTTDASVGCPLSDGPSATISAQVSGVSVVIDTLRIEVGRIRNRTRTFTRIRAQHQTSHAHPFAVLKEGIPGVLRRMFDEVAVNGTSRNLEGSDYAVRAESSEVTEPVGELSSLLPSTHPHLVADDGTDITVVLDGVVFDTATVSSACSLIAKLLARSRSTAYR